MTTSESLLAFVSANATNRRRAVSVLTSTELQDPTTLFALRRLLAADPDIAVRALAASALGRTGGSDSASWLIAAFDDRSPVVRDAVIRAVARRRCADAFARLCELAAADTTWWVRRAAVYALGVIAGDDAIGPARAALGDPFWRVRHAAVQVLALRGAQSPERRQEIVAGIEGGTGDYLRTLWGPTLIDETTADATASRLPEPLRDRDPAVVTARLAALDSPPALALVELLCDPHQPLRELAARRVLESDDRSAYLAALNWLDEPRIPHVAATVTAMLDMLGDAARALVCDVLADAAARRGALQWAIGWVVATRDKELAARAWQRARSSGFIDDAVSLADRAELVELLPSARGATALAIADELALRGVVPRTLDGVEPDIRMRLIAAAGEHRGWQHVEQAADDPHDGTRAVALAYLARSGKLDDERRHRALAHPDPGVREAAITGSELAALDALLATERDPWVRRTAARARCRGGSAPALLTDRDPWIRAQAIEALDLEHLDLLLELVADPEPIVQSAVIDRLASVSDARLRDALASAELSSRAQASTQAWLAAATVPEESPIDPLTDVTPVTPPRIRDQPIVERRALGRTNIAVPPLVISGAFDVQPGSLRLAADAGVELFFWEPTYAAMTRFLRSQRQRTTTRVVTGSYHADAVSIISDVDRALRRLRRDTLDVFLLFWARSAARLDDAAFTTLDRLKQDGKIRATGFSTHDRALAISALERSAWDVIMTRHSAAHPGIETELLARAQAADTAVLTFSALCYGRMVSGDDAPSAADCYRYSLTQPGVTACISAPRRHRELVENLEVLAQPMLDTDGLTRLRAHGATVRIENQRFNTLIRQPTRDAAAAAMAMLEAELPEDREEPCTTPASLGRSLHSRGRGRASLPSAMLRRGRL